MSYRKCRNFGAQFSTLKTCTECGCRRMLASFPTLPGERRRSDRCNVCLLYPSAVRASA